MKKPSLIAASLAIAASLLMTDLAAAGDIDWSQPIVARGSYRAKLRSLPITDRPNRPFHFYGNTVRRAHRQLQLHHASTTKHNRWIDWQTLPTFDLQCKHR